MKNTEFNNIDRNDFFVVKNGIVLILCIFGLTLLSLILLKIGDRSVLEMVLDYYFR